MKENTLELFKVSLDTNGMIRVSFSDSVKENRSIDELEVLLLEDVTDHLHPFIIKLMQIIHLYK